MKIEGRTIDMKTDYLSPVTYKPSHVTSPKDYELGVLVDHNDKFVKVLYCNNRTVQSTDPRDLVWG